MRYIRSTSIFSNHKANRCKEKFTYPLAPEPPYFCHPGVSLRDSPKSKVFNYWKSLVQSDNLSNAEPRL